MNNIAIDIRLSQLAGATKEAALYLKEHWSDGQLWYEMGLEVPNYPICEHFGINTEEYFTAVTAAFNEKGFDALNAQKRRVA